MQDRKPKHDAEQRGPADLVAIARAGFEHCRPGYTFADLQRRARYEKDSKGLLAHWLMVAQARLAHRGETGQDFSIAAE